MSWSFNVFTGNLDQTGSGAVVFEGEVEEFGDLPETVGDPAVGASYLVRSSTGVWLVNRKQAGIWIRRNNTGVRATDWEYGGDYPVNSVNGQSGNVVLAAADVGASATGHTHTAADITDFEDAVVEVSPPADWGSIGGELSSQTDLSNALNGKQDAGNYAAASHEHTASDITSGLAAVATSNSYTSLDDKPSLGTAAELNAPPAGNNATSDQVVLGSDTRLTDTRDPNAHSHDAATTDAAGFLSASDKTKLDGIASGAEVNVQADWTQATNTADDYIKNKPTLGTAAAKDAPASGNATSSQVVLGDDTRLSDARTPTSHTHAASDVTSGTLSIDRIPTGTSSTTVSLGNHTHSQLHDRSHAMTGTSDHTAGNWKLFYSNGSGEVTELALGSTAGHVLQTNGASAAPSFAAAASGGSKTYFRATALDNQPPASAYATLDTRNSIAVLAFGDAAVASAVFIGVMPEGAVLTSGLTVNIHAMNVGTSGNVRWRVEFERMTTDEDADSFDTAAEANMAANGTSGIITVTGITTTNIDGITAGDAFRLRVSRVGNDATNDTASGNSQLVAVEIRSAA